MELTDRILDVLAKPEWREDPPGSGLIAEVLHERRRDVMAGLRTLRDEGRVVPAGGNRHTGTAGYALAPTEGL